VRGNGAVNSQGLERIAIILAKKRKKVNIRTRRS
jgi:hypothetical protein